MQKYKITIEQDQDPINPRKDFDSLGKMVCFHRRYNLGDVSQFDTSDYDSWEELEAGIQKEESPVVILSLYLYDHSGITISTTPFSCSFDSGQIGFIYATEENVLAWFGKKSFTEKLKMQVEEALLQEVATYDQYLCGEVYDYTIENEKGEYIDSCCGFFGREACEQEAKESVEYLKKRDKEAADALVRIFSMQPCCCP